MLKKLKNNNFVTSFILTSFLLANFFGVQASASGNYEENKQSVDKLILQIEEEYKNVNTDFESVDSKKETLNAELERLEKEIRSVEIMLNTAKMTTQEIDKVMEQNENRIATFNLELQELLRSIQQENTKTPFQLILTSDNIGQMFGRMRNMSSVQNQVRDLRDDIEFEREEIIKNKDLKEDLKNSLPEKQALLKSKQESLNKLRDQTKGDEGKYQEILAELKKQEDELNSQLSQVNSDLKELKPGESRTNCYFEDKGNLDIYRGDFIRPISGYLTQRFSCRHDGIDIAAPTGTPIKAVADGTVVKKGYFGGSFGNFVILRHDLANGERVYSLSAHMNRPAIVSVGQKVNQGQQIGGVGSTGYSTGPHIHFMLLNAPSYEKSNVEFCAYGGGATKCYDPMRFFE